MNKLEEYRENMSGERTKEFENSNFRELWKEGFDAAIALDLPVKFAEWMAGGAKMEKFFPQLNWRYKGKLYDTQELYEYWINNIYDKS